MKLAPDSGESKGLNDDRERQHHYQTLSHTTCCTYNTAGDTTKLFSYHNKLPCSTKAISKAASAQPSNSRSSSLASSVKVPSASHIQTYHDAMY